MKWKYMKMLALFLVVPFILCGCWDEAELDTLSIVTGIGLDASNQQNEIDFWAQIGKVTDSNNTRTGGGTQEPQSSTVLMEAQSTSVQDALDKLDSESTRAIFLDHNQVIIFGRDQAKKGIEPYLDAFLRDYRVRMEVWMMVSDTTAKEVLSANSDQEKISAFGLGKMLENNEQTSQELGVSLLELTTKIIDPSTAPVLPIVSVREQEGKKMFEMKGMAVFLGDKMVGELSNEQTMGFIMSSGKVKDGRVSFTAGDGRANLVVSTSKSKMTPVIDKDGGITMNLQIKAKATISELIGFNKKPIHEIVGTLKQRAQQTIEEEVRSCFEKTQYMKTDIYGFGAAIHRKNAPFWHQIDDGWPQLYQKVKLALTVEVEITDTGKIADALTMMEEAK